jgi:hypothetical protein
MANIWKHIPKVSLENAFVFQKLRHGCSTPERAHVYIVLKDDRRWHSILRGLEGFSWYIFCKGVCGLVGFEYRSGSLDGSLDFVHVTHLVPGDHQLFLGLLLPVLHVPVCVGNVAFVMLLGFLELHPFHRGHIHLHHWEHDLATVGRGKDMHVLVSLKGRFGLHDSTSNIGIGGHPVVGVLWRVVSVGSKLLSLCSQMDTLIAILLDLLFTTLWSCLVLVAMISGSAGAVFSVLVTQQLLRLVPGPARSWWR